MNYRTAIAVFIICTNSAVSWGKSDGDVQNNEVMTPEFGPRSAPSKNDYPQLDKHEIHLPFASAQNRSHPQVKRAEQLVEQLMAKAYGTNWDKRGIRVPTKIRKKAEIQASEEYIRYFALAQALRNVDAKSQLEFPAEHKNKNKSIPPMPCAQIAWLVGRIAVPQTDASEPKKRKPDSLLTNAIINVDEKSQAKANKQDNAPQRNNAPSSCLPKAVVLRATVENLQQVFGEIRGWDHFSKRWVEPIAGKQKQERKKKQHEPNAEEIVLDAIQSNTAEDADNTTKPNRIRPPLQNSKVPARVRMLGHK